MKKKILIVGKDLAGNDVVNAIALANGIDVLHSSLEEKRAEINKILDDAEAALQALGCKYFLAAIDRDERDPEGGKVFVDSDHNGADMAVIMQHAFPSNKDLIYLGVSIGNEIMRRNKEASISFRDKKRKNKKAAPKAPAVKCAWCKQLNGEHHAGCPQDK